MSHCKACKMEIDQKATKCPHCQAYQQWYKNPQNYGLLFMLPFIAVIFFWQSTILKSKQFTEYQKQFTVEKVKEILSDDGKRVIITYKIKNETQYKWEDLTYEMIGTDEDGDLVLTEAGSEYSWVIQPKEEAYLTVMVEKNKNVYSWDVRITDMETSVF